MNAQHTPTMTDRANAQVAAYAGSPVRFINARREAALVQAAADGITAEQIAYWKRIADGCAALMKAGAA